MNGLWLVVLCAPVLSAGCVHTARLGLRSEAEFQNAIRLTNHLAAVTLAPGCGRIVGYHFHGQPNLLWLNRVPQANDARTAATEWLNYGGARLWNLPEGDGRMAALHREWPPDETMDMPWTVTQQTSARVVCRSVVSPYTGLQATQDISLDADSTRLTIRYTLRQTAEKTVYAHLWPVTQIRLPQAVMLGCLAGYENRIRRLGGQWDVKRMVPIPHQQAVRFDWPPATPSKMGTLGTFVQAVCGDSVFTQTVSCDPRAEYADRVNCEVFVDPSHDMLELEVTSPARHLSAGEEIQLVVVWELFNGQISGGYHFPGLSHADSGEPIADGHAVLLRKYPREIEGADAVRSRETLQKVMQKDI